VREPMWLCLVALGVMAGLGMAGLTLLIRTGWRRRRRARTAAKIAAAYRRHKTASNEPGQPVTVDELIARNLAEGRAVRLNWEDPHAGQGDDWPTGVLPKVEPQVDP